MHPLGFLRRARIANATLERVTSSRDGALVRMLGDVVDPDRERPGVCARRHRLRNHGPTSAKEKAPRELLALEPLEFHPHYYAGESRAIFVTSSIPPTQGYRHTFSRRAAAND